MAGRQIIIRGTDHHLSKLNDQKILEIRSKYPKKNGKELAAEYNVSKGTIYSILHRRTWKHV